MDIRWNGKELAFETCSASADLLGHGCSYTDFKRLMKGIWYEGSYDLDKACLQTFELSSAYFLK